MQTQKKDKIYIHKKEEGNRDHGMKIVDKKGKAFQIKGLFSCWKR